MIKEIGLKKRIRLVSCIALILICAEQIAAQISTVDNFNYYDINKNAFSVNTSCLGISPNESIEYAYRFTSIKMANELSTIFYDSKDSVDMVIGSYKLIKRKYLNRTLGGENFRYIMIRPNDSVTRPVILITHGGKTGGPTPLTTLTLGVFDYVQRGYAVVFYQSGTATGNSVLSIRDAGFKQGCTYDWSPDITMDCFQQAVYLKFQLGFAALDYTHANRLELKIDKNAIFASGFSGGALGSLYLALSDPGNFSNPIFDSMGGFRNLSRYPSENARIKAVGTLAGGILDTSATNYKIGPVIDNSDTETRFLLLHGQDDPSVQPETNPLQWADPAAELPGSKLAGSLSLDKMFKNKGIESKAIINCSACHNVFTWPCNYNDDCNGNNPLFSLGLCALWAANGNFTAIDFNNICSASNNKTFWNEMFYVLDQVHDNSKIIARFFHQDFTNAGANSITDTLLDEIFTNENVFAVNPKSFPFNKPTITTNGHYMQSKKCLSQTCTALYFNRLGNSNILGTNYKGDYLTLSGLDPTTFNKDFTLEIQFKSVNQIGIGTLFSHLDNLGFGFEVLITSNGFIQFKKNNISGQGAITGNTSVLDSTCHSIAVTRNANEFGLYLDGILQETKKTYNLSMATSIVSKLGNSSNELLPEKGFDGIIRHLVLWNKALSDTKLGQTNINLSDAALNAEWIFNEGYGQSIQSTLKTATLRLGIATTNADFDPLWMKNDVLCECKNVVKLAIGKKPSNNAIVDIRLYPNPSNGNFIVEFIEGSSLPEFISIFSIQGSLISTITITKYKQPISNFNKGVYFIQITRSNQVFSRKLIVL